MNHSTPNTVVAHFLLTLPDQVMTLKASSSSSPMSTFSGFLSRNIVWLAIFSVCVTISCIIGCIMVILKTRRGSTSTETPLKMGFHRNVGPPPKRNTFTYVPPKLPDNVLKSKTGFFTARGSQMRQDELPTVEEQCQWKAKTACGSELLRFISQEQRERKTCHSRKVVLRSDLKTVTAPSAKVTPSAKVKIEVKSAKTEAKDAIAPVASMKPKAFGSEDSLALGQFKTAIEGPTSSLPAGKAHGPMSSEDTSSTNSLTLQSAKSVCFEDDKPKGKRTSVSTVKKR